MKAASPFVSQATYRADIDTLRAVAVILVVLFHAAPESIFRNGYLGVDIFFVVSGYVISKLAFEDLNAGRFSIVHFYIRRIRRILPTLITVVVVTYIVWAFFFTDVNLKDVNEEVTSVLGYYSNIFYESKSGYFDISSEKRPFIHTWSLSVEEQFYLIFPFFLLIISLIRPKVATIISLIAGSLFYFVYLSVFDQSAAFYTSPARAWQFLSGGVVAFLSVNRSPSIHSFGGIPFHLALAGLVLLILVSGEIGVVGNVLATVVAAVAVYFSRVENNQIGIYVLLSKIGIISYPLYLWHWPVLVFLNEITQGYHGNLEVIYSIILSLLLSILTYTLIEKPIRTSKRENISAVIIIALSASFLILTIIFTMNKSFSATDMTAKFSIGDYSAERAKISPCLIEPKEARPTSWCFQSGAATPEAAIIGDSHADHLFVGASIEGAKENWIFLGSNSCPFGIQEILSSESDRKCDENNRKIIKIVNSDVGIKKVFISFVGSYYVDKYKYARQHRDIDQARGPLAQELIGVPDTEKLSALEEGLRTAVRQLVDAGKEVILIENVPELPFDPKSCAYRWTLNVPNSGCALSRQVVEVRNDNIHGLFARIAATEKRVSLFRAVDVLCDNAFCYVKRDGVFLYRDSHHLSIEGSRRVAAELIRRFF